MNYEASPTTPENFEFKLAQIENSVNNLADLYYRRAEKERAKFEDDSYDSDISGAWSTAGMIEARKNYELYVSIARDILSVLA